MKTSSSVLLFPFFLIYFISPLLAQKKVYTTQKIAQNPVIIDGLMNDAAWETVEWGGDFTQRQPSDGGKPSQNTAFKILYDDKNLYVLIRAFDTEPDKIVRRMSRRDGFDGDLVEINIDSYFDQRTAFSFTASVSGVKGEEAISNNGNQWDASWDPIWYLKTSIDDQGWIAEFRIPLSQLRFADKEEHVWGLEVSRMIFRKNEWSNWQYIPKSSAGWVHLFGELKGLKGIKSQKQIEIMPYVVGQVERYKREEGNPYATGKDEKLSAGVDGKIGITSNITLDFSVNPDFGQVEADPSQVNLSAFEVFFKEQRPFFVESKNILDYTITKSATGGTYSQDNLFYSRRIGRSPHHTFDVKEGQFLNQPNNTSILGAFKLTGKTKQGLSFGIMEALTAKEKAEIYDLGERRKETVEPLSNYLIGRLQKDFNKGNTILGGMITAVNRDLDPSLSNSLNREAYSAGLDFVHNWKDRKYFVSGNILASQVIGSPDAILEIQTSPLRYFQRPQANHIAIDSSANHLSGTGGTLKIGKGGGGNIRFETGSTWRTPKFEINDIGYLRNADQIHQWTWVGYQMLKPHGMVREFFLNFNQTAGWDFSGTSNYKGANINFRIQLKNYWWLGSGIAQDFNSISNFDLRGGPAIKYPGGINHWYFVESDNRKKLQVVFEHSNYWGNDEYSREQSYSVNLSYRPFNALQISASPNYNRSNRALQYVCTSDFEDKKRYVNASIEQKTLGMAFRINYIIKPNLSIQYYGQPFVSKGNYSKFKHIIKAKAARFNDRFETYSATQIAYDKGKATFIVDENLDGKSDYEFDNPNFNFLQFRSNLVARWEYIPGSTLFLVWSQSRTGEDDIGNFTLSNISQNLFDITGHNIFLIKYTYRLRS